MTDNKNTVKLWARVGMTLEVSEEVYAQLQFGNKEALMSVFRGETGNYYLDGETYFPDIEQNRGLEEMEFDLYDGPKHAQQQVMDIRVMPEEAIVYMVAGGVKHELYSGTMEECESFCQEHNWSFMDENEFVWGLEIEENALQQEQTHPSLADTLQVAERKKEEQQQRAANRPLYDLESTVVTFENYKSGINNLTVCRTNPIGESAHQITANSVITCGTEERDIVLLRHAKKLDEINRSNMLPIKRENELSH